MTMTRSRRETVVFQHPFRIASIERLLPAGSYEVITDEESTEGLAFPSFRPIATMMMVPAPPPRSPSVEMVTISSIDLSEAREPMRWRGAPVDLDKHRGRAAPNTTFAGRWRRSNAMPRCCAVGICNLNPSCSRHLRSHWWARCRS